MLANRKFHALNFGTSPNDYIYFTPPDMAPFQTSFTLCTWLKKLHVSSHSMVFSYDKYPPSHHQILVGDDGYYNRALDSMLDGTLTGKFTIAKRNWFHYCASWSQSSQTHKIYLNGEQVGSGTTKKESSLSLNGTIFMGRNPNTGGTQWVFGGEVFKLNMFSRKLSSTEIERIARSGLCSTEEEKFKKSRYLRWEYILGVPRTGSVTEVDSGCPTREQLLGELESFQNQTLGELESFQNQTLGELESFQNQTQRQLDKIAEKLEQLRSTSRSKVGFVWALMLFGVLLC